MLKSFARSRRGRRLLGTTQFVVLSNFLRSGIVDFLASRSDYASSLDEIVDFYFATAIPAPPEDIDLLQQYYTGAAKPTKIEFIHFLMERASWMAGQRKEMKFRPPDPAAHDWNPILRSLHAQYDPKFPGSDAAKRSMARAHWDNFLTMANAFDIVRYEKERAQLSESQLKKLRRELAVFGDGYFGLDDLLGVLLKVEALRGETSWIVRPPPFMLEACDAVARQSGIESYWRFSPQLHAGGCRVLDLGCGSGIYSNAFAERGNECVAVDRTPWVFFRAFLGARTGVQVECCDMNAMPETLTRGKFTHLISNLAAHHFRNRTAMFTRQRELLRPGGEICVLNFDYSVRHVPRWNPVARIRNQFASQVRYNWGVLEYDHGGVDFVSPEEVARELESAGFSATVHPCGVLRELFFVRGRKN
jgi:SAM-dependent methyltransferase